MSPMIVRRETEWRSRADYPLYRVSSLGEVRGRSDKPLRHEILKGGYHRICLQGPGGRRHVLVHVLVAGLFLGPKPSGFEVNHIDGDKANNAAENLEYVTPRQNVRHSIDVLGVQRAKGSRNGNARLTESAVRQIRARYAAGTVTRRGLAREHGVHPSTIDNVVSGRRWKHVQVCGETPAVAA